jgi:nitroreductase
MDVFDAVRTMLAVRQYQDAPIPEATVRRIVEAGRLTGSSRNLQPWQFVVVQQRETLQQLGALTRTGPYVAQAGAAIVVLIDDSVYAVSDASRATEAMLLTAWSEGVGSNWVGFLNLDEVKRLLAIPNELRVLGVLSFGYPAQPVGRGRKRRKALAEIAHRGRFGVPFE